MDEEKTINKVTVSIFNEEYIVKGAENPDYIKTLASYVDRKMKNIEQRNSYFSVSKIAILTALNIADELNKLQEDYDELLKQLADLKKQAQKDKLN